MCGRYTLHSPWAENHNLYGLVEPEETHRNVPARYNIAPSQNVLTVRLEDGAQCIREVKWGLVPHWAKEGFNKPQINARGETVHEKPMFRDAFKRGRCLIPADGYYEWTGPKGNKQPYYIHMDGQPFSFAGIWARNDNLEIESCAIITTSPAEQIAHIHNRMPVILKPEWYDLWLDPETPKDQAHGLLEENMGDVLKFHAVGKAVGKVSTQGPECVEPI